VKRRVTFDADVLAVKTRRDLFQFVRRNPGYHLREVARALQLSITLADYHLRFLEKNELISSVMDGEYKRYYPRSVPGDTDTRPALSDSEKRVLAYLRQPVPLSILTFLMERESATHKEILGNVTVSASTLSHHLKKMTFAGVIAEAEGRERGYRVAMPKTVARLMATYELASPDQVDTFLRVWGEFRVG
jgi:predicted transcriptional regulator